VKSSLASLDLNMSIDVAHTVVELSLFQALTVRFTNYY